MTNEGYLEEIKKLRDGETIKNYPSLIAFMVRDWRVTEEAELHDLCWAMCRDAYVTEHDAVFLLNKLEEHITGQAK